MRKIKMIGSANALPPYSFGLSAFVPETEAHQLVQTGELQYADARDVVSDEAFALHMAKQERESLQAMADRDGVDVVVRKNTICGKPRHLPLAADSNPVVGVIRPRCRGI